MIIDDARMKSLKRLNVQFACKSSSRIMRSIGFFSDQFYRAFWTTIGNTIYYPTTVIDPLDDAYYAIVQHEVVHVQQYRDFLGGHVPGWLWLLLYICFPVPIFFAWFRWAMEREAYVTQLTTAFRGSVPAASLDFVVDSLWSDYGWCWPKPLMRRWFKRRIRWS